MLHQWISRQSTNSTADLLADALRAIGRHDVITQCMTDRQQVRDDSGSNSNSIEQRRQDAIDALAQRTSSHTHTHLQRITHFTSTALHSDWL